MIKNEDCDKKETKIKEHFFKQWLPDYLKWFDFLPDFIPLEFRPVTYFCIIYTVYQILYINNG